MWAVVEGISCLRDEKLSHTCSYVKKHTCICTFAYVSMWIKFK